MVAALYRRYRPETFAELIGQSQVTDPLRTALRTDRVGHAYLFSGPRGCGKTTSARILARCLNCEQGPTDTPCGTCPSCIELGRDGGGSLDVVEIDAASHNGVDDARDLRERAVFAPARDRFKIFILDEAHMVTPQGFNALLKIVEEPPEHVKFIFATTEPEKVIGTIRSRTHHYPFRLVPPAQLLDYVARLCAEEGVEVEPGVLPLVVRAGGGSVRDTLSILDQLIAGSEGPSIGYERAVALLGYTHGELLDEIVDAVGSGDAPAVFAGIDRVIQTGQDPRRFVEDLLERFRDLIIVEASPQGAASLLRGVPQDQLDRMSVQAGVFGPAALSRAADIANAALTEMSGATSPRLHLELLAARLLLDPAPASVAERAQRVEAQPSASVGPSTPSLRSVAQGPGAESGAPAGLRRDASPEAGPATPVAATPVAERPSTSSGTAQRVEAHAESTPSPVKAQPEPDGSTAAVGAGAAAEAHSASALSEARAQRVEAQPSASTGPSTPSLRSVAQGPESSVTSEQLKHAWPEILASIERTKRSAWLVATTATVRGFDGEVLTLGFANPGDIEAFKRRSATGEGVSDLLRGAIQELLGVRVKFVARLDGAAPSVAEPAEPVPAVEATSTAAPQPAASAAPSIDWVVAAIPTSESAGEEEAEVVVPPVAERGPEGRVEVPAAEPAQPETDGSAAAVGAGAAVEAHSASTPSSTARYGEAVVRELLGARFIEEQPIAPPAPAVALPVAGEDGAPPPPDDADAPPPDDEFGFAPDGGR